MGKRQILTTSALPYANGDLHIGHLIEYVQTDIWVRHQKSMGNTCHYICASDTHGTPIMLNAKKRGMSPEDLVHHYRKLHMKDFKDFYIDFDFYGSTHSDTNRHLCESIFEQALSKKAIYTAPIEQLYSEKDAMFLPDRFVKGQCPYCDAEDQYGDSCEICSATYSPKDLRHPRSVISGDTPVTKTSDHYFFRLRQFQSTILAWLESNPIPEEAKKTFIEWFNDGLKDWDISRDAPYFGFKIPGSNDKYFYVWLDAPIGYISTTLDWCQDPALVNKIWTSKTWEIHHFIGKDIMYFHCLFWPALLSVADYSLPTKVSIHGFLTVDGKKMSKSRGTFIKARTYLDHLDPDFLRFYYASKLSPKIEDIDLNIEDFVFKVNSDVLGKIINIASRLGSIVTKHFDGILGELDQEGQALVHLIEKESPHIYTHLDRLEYSSAVKEIMGLATQINKYIDTHEPWSVVKTDTRQAQSICTAGLHGLALISIYLLPIMPGICKKILDFLSIQNYNPKKLILKATKITPYTHIASRIDADEVRSNLIDINTV